MLRLCLLALLLVPGITIGQTELEDLGGSVQAQVEGETVVFPVLKTRIDGDIQGDLATITIKQTFANPTNTPLQATYLFPLNKDAAVFEMMLEVGDERIRADIQKIEQAQATFNQAKRAGKSAALLKQHRPNMFTQDIANLMPGQPVQVTLRYVQTVAKIDGEYELVLPLVVGPRFQPAGAGEAPQAREHLTSTQSNTGGVPQWDLNNPPALAGGATDANSQTQFGQWALQQLPDYPPVDGLHIPKTIDAKRVSIALTVNAGMPIQAATSATHTLSLDAVSETKWDVTLAAGEIIDNRDFVLRYSLSGATNQAGLLAYRDQRGGFFSLLLEPPATVTADQVSPREIVFVLDCSGSMQGLPMAASKAFAREALNRLRPDDTFRIIRFSDAATEFSTRPLAATPGNIQQGIQYLNSLRGSGGTVMSSGILQALTAPLAPDAVRLVHFLTDGYIGNEYDILRLIHDNIGAARLFSFGVGTSVNRFLLAEMGRVGRGFARFMDPTEDVDDVAEELVQRIQAPVLTDVEIDWGDLDAAAMTPQPIPDLFAGQSVRIMGRYAQPGDYEITIRGRAGNQAASLPLRITLPEQSRDGEAVALVWARSAIKQAMHQLSAPMKLRQQPLSDDQLKQRVINLGLEHSLVTQWTAFVAVSEKIYNANPTATPTRPVPLSQVEGVSELAYGEVPKQPQKPAAPMVAGGTQLALAPQANFNGNATPEPAFWAGLLLLTFSLSMILMLRRRNRFVA